MQKRNNAVIDTGVLVSAFVFGGIPIHAVQKSFKETTVFVSTQLLHEYREVPRALYTAGKINDEQLRALISGIAAHAEYLITGDKDLLSIDMLPFKLKIVTPRMFVND